MCQRWWVGMNLGAYSEWRQTVEKQRLLTRTGTVTLWHSKACLKRFQTDVATILVTLSVKSRNLSCLICLRLNDYNHVTKFTFTCCILMLPRTFMPVRTLNQAPQCVPGSKWRACCSSQDHSTHTPSLATLISNRSIFLAATTAF